MPASDPGLRRVSVHAGTTDVDLALPTGVPVAVLIPSIVDILDGSGQGSSGDLEAKRYQLCTPGAFAFDTSTTLAQNGIRDGDVLVLIQSPTPPPAPRYDDVAEAVSTMLDAALRPETQPQATRLTGAVAASCLTVIGALALIRNAATANAFGESRTAAGVAALAGFVALLGAAIAHRSYRDAMAGLALSVMGIAFAAVAGFLAVPGAPATPNALLAAAAAAATSVLAMRVVGCGVVTLTAVACAATLVAAAALVGVMTAAPLPALGSVSTLICLGLIGLAPRLSIALAGLSPRLAPPPDLEPADGLADKAFRADNWLTGLLAAFSSSAAAGAVVTVLGGAPRLCCMGFGALTGASLLLHARSHARARRLVFVSGGIAVIATTFAAVASGVPGRGGWLAAATATLAATAICLGFVAPGVSPSPLLRRGVEVLECVTLAALVPLTCWVCGLYNTVRGLTLT
ncbi:type VII secretion integral membrane protein EccD [Mycobacterium sp. 852002-51057_SCH5723018]|uniref:type VII secretion integral membrane protein EccD n=1 Tax=Mycobacterium sp. 852002-51057_SCH5723018 TaxID=1834094 RepID=UPI0007FD2F34|nr:type VII secretion integral membrane protein EccD [Mycobacterium sp. 852002-51057_SCH5723018]OBG22373.1 type VII secretion integral membrane protein EccD [Mycobacterium sp. 852002-51057_SCH5723018]